VCVTKLGIQTLLELIGRPDDYLRTIADAHRAQSSISGAGYGMFATRALTRGALLCVLDGQEVDCDTYPELMHALEWNALSERVLLVRPLRTSYGYINHAAVPNVAIDPDGHMLRVVRDLAEGDELTIDYFAPPIPQAYLDSPEGQLLTATPGRK
jgi:uncharacterized protein